MLNNHPGMLNEEQVKAITGIQDFLRNLGKRIERVNTVLLADNHFPVRPLNLPAFEAGRLMHELDGLLFNHDLAMAKLRQAACAEPERLAA